MLTVCQVFVNQALFTPLFNSYFFGMQTLLSGASFSEIINKLVEQLQGLARSDGFQLHLRANPVQKHLQRCCRHWLADVPEPAQPTRRCRGGDAACCRTRRTSQHQDSTRPCRGWSGHAEMRCLDVLLSESHVKGMWACWTESVAQPRPHYIPSLTSVSRLLFSFSLFRLFNHVPFQDQGLFAL